MTSQASSRQYLQQQLILAEKSKNWLEHSLRQAESIKHGELSTADYVFWRLYRAYMDVL
jgi:hypothetical protein